MIKKGMIVSLLFLCGSCLAQNKSLRIDSLLHELRLEKKDSSRVTLYYRLSLEYLKSDPVRARQFVDTGMLLAKKIKWAKGVSYLYIAEGNILNDAGQGTQAIALYKKAYSISELADDKLSMSNALNDMGGVYYQQSDFVNATTYYTRALKLAEASNNDNQVATCYTNLSTVFYNQQNYDRAIDYGVKALKRYEKIKDPDKIARSLNYIGNIYFGKGDKEKTKEYYDRAISLYRQTGNKTGMAILYSQIAILYDPDYTKIIEYQERSQAIWDSINPSHYNSIINLGNMGESYLNIIRADSLQRLSTPERKNLLNKAAGYLHRSIQYARQSNDRDNLSYFSGVLAAQQELAGDYKSSIANYKLHYEIRDSLYSQENKNKIASIESEREIGLRDKQIELNKLALLNQKRQRIALIVGISLLLVIGGLLYFQSRTRKRTNTTLLQLNTELDEANKIKARFFAILSHDLRSPISNLISFLELQQSEPGLLGAAQAAVHQNNISKAAHSLLENMETMLVWSKGQMENFKPQIRVVTVADMFTHIRDFFGTTNGIRFVFSNPDNLSVSTDENYLKTIMHNLTANAVKALLHTPGATIEWKARQVNGKTILSVTDNGPGMDEQQAKALYDDSSVPNSKTGFGLHLIRDLAKAIHFTIAMQSKPGKGTSFILSA